MRNLGITAGIDPFHYSRIGVFAGEGRVPCGPAELDGSVSLAEIHAREAYEPPLIRKVKLVPGEMAVAGCKSTQITPTLCRRGTQLFIRTIGS